MNVEKKNRYLLFQQGNKQNLKCIARLFIEPDRFIILFLTKRQYRKTNVQTEQIFCHGTMA